GEKMDGEVLRTSVDEDALAAPRLAQKKCKGMGGDHGSPSDQHPRKPERARGQPDIDRGANERAGNKGDKVDEEYPHRQVFEHASPFNSALCNRSRILLPQPLALIESNFIPSKFVCRALEFGMGKFGLLVVVIAGFAINLPALLEQWRRDRRRFVKS